MKSIRLTRSHRHFGVTYAPGAVLTLHDRNATWLIEQGAAVEVASSGTSALTRAAPAAGRKVRGCCGGKW